MKFRTVTLGSRLDALWVQSQYCYCQVLNFGGIELSHQMIYLCTQMVSLFSSIGLTVFTTSIRTENLFDSIFECICIIPICVSNLLISATCDDFISRAVFGDTNTFTKSPSMFRTLNDLALELHSAYSKSIVTATNCISF